MAKRTRRLLGSLLLGVLLLAALLWWALGQAELPGAPAPTVADGEGPTRVPELMGADGRHAPGSTPAAAAEAPGGDEATGAVVDEPMEPEARDPIGFVVDTVDGLTGRYVRGTWNLGTGRVVSGPFAPGQARDAEAIARQRRAAEASAKAWEDAFVPAGTAKAGVVHPDDVIGLGFVVRPPRGYVLAASARPVRDEVAADARLLRWVEPVWREAVLDVRVFGPEGRPVPSAHVAAFSAAGRIFHPPVSKPAPGELRIGGIPHMPGEPVRVRLGWGGEEPPEEEEPASEVLEEIDEATMLEGAHVKTTIPEELARPWRVDVHLESLAVGLLDTVEFDEDLGYEETFSTSEVDEDALASARVTVLDHAGEPIHGAEVGGRHTNAKGEVYLPRLDVRMRWLRAKAPGRFPMALRVDLDAGREHAFTLREQRGARLDVVVVDAQGRPRPSARIGLSGRAVFDIEDGVQRTDRYADERGRRSFARVMAGKLTVRAWWGSQHGKAEVTLVDGERSVVRVITR